MNQTRRTFTSLPRPQQSSGRIKICPRSFTNLARYTCAFFLTPLNSHADLKVRNRKPKDTSPDVLDVLLQVPERRHHHQYLLREQNFRAMIVRLEFQEFVVGMVLLPFFTLFCVSLLVYSSLAFPWFSEGADEHHGSMGKLKIPSMSKLAGE